MSGQSPPEGGAGASGNVTPMGTSLDSPSNRTLVGSFRHPQRGLSHSAAIEQFLLDGQLGDMLTGPEGSGGGPGLANSVASTLPPGDDSIRGPTNNNDNMSSGFSRSTEAPGGRSVEGPGFGVSPLGLDKQPLISPRTARPASSGTPSAPPENVSQKRPEDEVTGRSGVRKQHGREGTVPPTDSTPMTHQPAHGSTPAFTQQGGQKVIPVRVDERMTLSGRDNPSDGSGSGNASRTDFGARSAAGGKGAPRRTRSVGDSLFMGNYFTGNRPAQDVSPQHTHSPNGGSWQSSAGSARTTATNQLGGRRNLQFVWAHSKSEAGGRTNQPSWLSAAGRLQRDGIGLQEKRHDPLNLSGATRSDWLKVSQNRLRASDLMSLGQGGGPNQSSPGALSNYSNRTRLTDRSRESPTTPNRDFSVSNSGALSVQFSGRQVHVRARPTQRASLAKEMQRSSSTSALLGLVDRKNISGSKASFRGGVTGTNVSRAVNHAEDMFMSSFSGSNREKPRPPPLFATDSSSAHPVSEMNGLKKRPLFANPAGSVGGASNAAGGGGAGGGGSGGGGGGGGGGDGGKGDRKITIVQGDEEEREERHFGEKSSTALHAIPWDQRSFIPISGFGTRTFSVFSAPIFWEKLDWTVRASLFTVLPTMILTLEPTTAGIFPFPSSVAFLAFWITMPTFGAGLREFFIALKGYALSLVILMIVIAIDPRASWLILLLLFFLVLVTAFFAEQVKKTCAYCLAIFLMQLQAEPNNTGIKFVEDYFVTLLIALAFGLAAFFIPNIRWSSDLSKTYVSILGNSLSIYVQGICSSFWCPSPLERELNLVRLRQLHATVNKAISKASSFYSEAKYEPHTGSYMSAIHVRYEFLLDIRNILSSMVQVVELINDSPQRIDTRLCVAFGSLIAEDLAVIASAMDNMILKISDFRHPVHEDDIQMFNEARERFQDRLSEVRQEVILDNEMYETDESDVLLGFFMFSVDELCEVISTFDPTKKTPSALLEWVKAPINDCKSSFDALRFLINSIIHQRTLTRRAKEAIKLALCMTLPGVFQVYALNNNDTSPVAGASIIAFVYSQTGAQSFSYAVNRVLGTVLGSLTALLAVQIANGNRLILYVGVGILSFLGAYIQTSPTYFAAGNAICNSVISVITQFHNPSAAMVRIQQNVFAILIYFCITMVLWPMRARSKVTMSLDISLRCFREATCRLLRNLDLPDDVGEVNSVVTDVLNEWKKKIVRQESFLPGAATEPTVVGADFPESSWEKLIAAQWNLWSIISMMRFAYVTFMSSKVGDMSELSVHWVVLRRISPHAKDLSDLVYAAVDLYLLAIGKTTVVPTSHLTRLRHGIQEAEHNITETYIQTICRKLGGDDSDEEMEEAFGDGEYDGFNNYGDYVNTGNNDGNVFQYNPNGNDIGYGGAGSPRNKGHNNNDNNNNNNNSENDTNANNNNDTKENKSSFPDGGGDPNETRRYMGTTTTTPRHAAEPPPQENQKKKKGGYLMYTLTKEEEDELRQHLINRSIAARRKSGAEEDADENNKNNNKKEGKGFGKDSFAHNRSFFGIFGKATHSEDYEIASSDDIPKALKKKNKKKFDNLDATLKDAGRETKTGDKKQKDESTVDDEDTASKKQHESPGEIPRESTGGVKTSDDGALQHNFSFECSHGSKDESPPANREEKISVPLYSSVSIEHSSGDRSSIEPSEDYSKQLQDLSAYDCERKEFVLSNKDIHSLEAFLFGARALTVQLGELQKALLEMQHAQELAKKV